MTLHLLRGPADADTFRVKEGNARRYLDHLDPDELRPLEMARSVPAMSTIKGAEGKGGLIPWTARNVATAAVDDYEIWHRMPPEDAVEWLAKAGDRARDKAAGRGTNVHAYIERLIDGRGVSSWDEADAGSEYRPAIERFVEVWQPVLRYAEVVAFGNVDGDEYAGTLDAIVELPGLGLRLIDYKSRAATANNPHTVYSGEVAQMGGYSMADYLIVEVDGKAQRIPMPALDGCALVTFTPDHYEVHPVDLDGARETFRRLHGWWRGEQLARAAVGRKAKPGGPTLDDLTKAQLVEKAAELGVEVRPSWSKAKLVEALDPGNVVDAAVTAYLDTELDPDSPQPVTEAATDSPQPVDETDEETRLAQEHALDTAVDMLRARAGKLIGLPGGEDALRMRWPAGVPGLSETRDYDHLAAINVAIDRAEADVGAPFDPPPTITEPRNTPTPASSSSPVDEGTDAGPDDVDTVRKAYAFAEADGKAWLADIAGRTGNLSLDQRASERRLLIGYSLIRLAVAGWHDDELLAACLNYSEVSTGHVDDAPGTLATLTPGLARRLSDTVGELVAERLTFSVDPDGRMRLTAV